MSDDDRLASFLLSYSRFVAWTAMSVAAAAVISAMRGSSDADEWATPPLYVAAYAVWCKIAIVRLARR